MSTAASPELSRFERAAMALGRLNNEAPALKWLQGKFIHGVSKQWVRTVVRNRLLVDGLEHVRDLDPDRGVVLVANHRTFFDLYIAMLAMSDGGADWARRMYFPVRADFFYQRPTGVLVNMAMGAGVMYPPIFRDKERRALNRDAVDRIVGFLAKPGTLVGMHPEGQRNKSDDPYELLRAQPGVGELILRARPIVLPVFIGGLSNDFLADARLNFQSDARRVRPLSQCYGPPVDYSQFTQAAPRMSLYKKTSDHALNAVRALGERERELRAACCEGRVGDDDPRWHSNW
jgi:1-acyl-sn-glycerol-3-phosphate acyltransferase